MDYVYIEQLIDRYFEAATTIEEERILRAFFSQREVPQHLRHYTPLFLMEADEIAEKPHLDDAFDRKIMARLEAEGPRPRSACESSKDDFRRSHSSLVASSGSSGHCGTGRHRGFRASTAPTVHPQGLHSKDNNKSIRPDLKIHPINNCKTE